VGGATDLRPERGQNVAVSAPEHLLPAGQPERGAVCGPAVACCVLRD